MFGLFKNKHKEENKELASALELANSALQAANEALIDEQERVEDLTYTVANLEKQLADSSVEIESLLDLIRILENPTPKKRKASKKSKR